MSITDPRALGALCDQCGLNGSPVVPSEGYPEEATLAIVAEAPGQLEEALAQPLIGPSGKETEAALLAAGLRREECFLTNASLCRPLDGSMRAHYTYVKSRNATRKKRGLPPILPGPVACRPRLMNELFALEGGLLLMGAFARQTFYPEDRGDSKLMASRGFPSSALIEIDGAERRVSCLSTVHPAYALRMGRWLTVFRHDVDKAVRMVRGQLQWKEPEMLFEPTPEQVASFLDEMETQSYPVAFDTETRWGLDWSRPLALRVLGIGTFKKAMAIPFQSVEEGKRIYSTEQLGRIGSICVDWFSKPGRPLAVHHGKFDECVCSHAREFLPGWKLGRKLLDTAIGHHVAWSEFPHTLEFLSAQYTDAPAHKAVDHSKWTDDREYHTYNMRDIAVTSLCAYKMCQEKKLIDQKCAFKTDMKMSTFCRSMEEVGLYVDKSERDKQSNELIDEQHECNEKIVGLLPQVAELDGAGKLKKALQHGWVLNPGSPDQIRHLLYDLLGFTPFDEREGGWTESGKKSVQKPLLFLMIDRGIPHIVEELILTIVDYREAQKLRGTYCTVEPATRDGRIHVVWNPHVVVSGRLSCSPNVMNIRKSLRGIYAAAPGHLYVACDKKQLEARVTAQLAGQQDQIDAFLAGADIHRVNAVALFHLRDVAEVTKELRQFTKTFIYAGQYLAKVEKILQMLRTFRTDKGERPYRKYTLEEAKVCYERMWLARREIMDFHLRNRRTWQERGYLEDVLHGRRRYFLDGEVDAVDEELANYIIQSTSAADVNEATFRLLEEFPYYFDGPGTGIVHQCHDSIIIECKEEHALDVGRRMQSVMDSMLGGMPLPVDLAIGPNYRDLKEVKL